VAATSGHPFSRGPSGSQHVLNAEKRTTIPVDTAERGQVVLLTHLLRLNPRDGPELAHLVHTHACWRACGGLIVGL